MWVSLLRVFIFGIWPIQNGEYTPYITIYRLNQYYVKAEKFANKNIQYILKHVSRTFRSEQNYETLFVETNMASGYFCLSISRTGCSEWEPTPYDFHIVFLVNFDLVDHK